MFLTNLFEPVFDNESRILILGTMPSPKSRELGFYYGHPRNRFWPVMADVLGEVYPETTEDKIAFCRRNHIAVWDVLKSCEITGADDNSIKNPVPNDMNEILAHAPIKAIFATGTQASTRYQKDCYPRTGIPIIKLPSTSPANCGTSYEKLRAAYCEILGYL